MRYYEWNKKDTEEPALRELSVYYCRKCGHYAYFQLPKNAVCPKCACAMTHLKIPYQEFMDLNYEERDQLISREIITSSPSFVKRIAEPGKVFNQRELLGKLTAQIEELEDENKKLTDTTEWMHETIWDLLRKNKALNQELNDLRTSYGKE